VTLAFLNPWLWLGALAVAAPQMQAVTLEYERDVENPGPALQECVAAIRQCG